jgi:hypothetical protein
MVMNSKERFTVTFLQLLVKGDKFRFDTLDLLCNVDFANNQGVTVYDTVARKYTFYSKMISKKQKVLKIINS